MGSPKMGAEASKTEVYFAHVYKHGLIYCGIVTNVDAPWKSPCTSPIPFSVATKGLQQQKRTSILHQTSRLQDCHVPSICVI